MRVLFSVFAVFLHFLNANASQGWEPIIPEGVHQYRVTFSRNGLNEKDFPDASMTLLGCHHYMCMQSLPETQQEILSAEATQSTAIYNERTDAHLNIKIRTYLTVLKEIALNPWLLESNFFEEYTKITSHGARYTSMDTHVIDYFIKIINQKLQDKLFNQMGIHMDERSLTAIRTLAIPEKVQKLPHRLVYDFTASYAKRTSLEYQAIDLHCHANPNFKSAALDEGCELKDNEEALFKETLDFSLLHLDAKRSQILTFYGSLAWMFDETPAYEIIPKTLAQQLQVLCTISEDMKRKIKDGVLIRKLQDDSLLPGCSALMLLGVKANIRSYLSGTFVLGTSAENVIERNYNWLKGHICNATNERQSLVIFGDAHLQSAGNNRGILQFFMDQVSENNEDFWKHTLGEEVWQSWQKVTIKSVERLTQEGVYVSFCQREGTGASF